MGCQLVCSVIETVFWSLFAFSDVLFYAAAALYHVNYIILVAVDVMGDRCDFTCRVECV